jgi:hypothetical protein
MKNPPPAYRPAARQPKPRLQPHVLLAYRDSFSRSLAKIEATDGDTLEDVIARQSRQALVSAIEDIDSGCVSIYELMNIAGYVEFNKSALIHLRLAIKYCGADEAQSIKQALGEIFKTLEIKRNADLKRSKANRKVTPEIKEEMNKRYQELINKGEHIDSAKYEIVTEFNLSRRTVDTYID